MKKFFKWVLRVIVVPVIVLLSIVQGVLKWVCGAAAALGIILGGLATFIGICCYIAGVATKAELITIILYCIRMVAVPMIGGIIVGLLEYLNKALARLWV